MTSPPVPQRIGSYTIQRRLGSGGMGTVYAALQKQPRRIVAIKVMRPSTRPDALRRFRREIEILGRLRHPCIAQVYEAGVHEGDAGPVPYLVMEYVPRARTIIEHADARTLSVDERLRLFVKVCAAVEHGHRRKVIHRDLKPANVLVDEDGLPKVIDFGIAHAVAPDLPEPADDDPARRIGTIEYLAPELCTPGVRDVGARVDVYALGVILYRLLCGRMPHDLSGVPVHAAARIVCEESPPRPASIRPELRGELEEVMLRAIEKDPERRYRDAGDLGRAVLAVLDRGARRPALGGRVRIVAGAIVLLALAGVAIVIAIGRLAPRALDRAAPLAVPVPVTAGAAGGVDADEREPTPAEVVIAVEHATAIALSPGGERLAVGEANGRVAIWPLVRAATKATGEAASAGDRTSSALLADHRSRIVAITFAPDGEAVLSVSEDGRCAVCDVVKGSLLGAFSVEPGSVRAATIRAGGSLVALAFDDSTVRVHDRTGALARTLRGSRGAFGAVAFDLAGALIAAGSDQGAVYVWEVASGRRLRLEEGLRDPVAAIGFDESGALAAISTRGEVIVWRGPGDAAATVEPEVRGATGMALVERAAFDHGGRWLAAVSRRAVEIVDLQARARRGEPIEAELGEEFAAAAIGADGGRCAIMTEAGAVRIVNVGAPP